MDIVLWVIACFVVNYSILLLVHSLLVYRDLKDYRACGGTCGWWRFRLERELCKTEFRHLVSQHEQGRAPNPPAPSLGAFVRQQEGRMSVEERVRRS